MFNYSIVMWRVLYIAVKSHYLTILLATDLTFVGVKHNEDIHGMFEKSRRPSQALSYDGPHHKLKQ